MNTGGAYHWLLQYLFFGQIIDGLWLNYSGHQVVRPANRYGSVSNEREADNFLRFTIMGERSCSSFPKQNYRMKLG